ncbi:MAG: preprotein translocase subunit SecA [bacterium]|nr:preprotein translocase subunit SecA [bacterium]
MLGFLKTFFKQSPQLPNLVRAINDFEPEIKELSSDELKERSLALKARVREGATLDEVLPEAFALTREAARRTLGQRHFDVQLLGGIWLHRGTAIEMLTGEGKTLTATAPTYLNALSGEGAHVITVNDYLARRDTVWMGQIYHALGSSVACLVHEGAFLYDPEWKIPAETGILIDKERDTTGSFLVQEEFLRPISRREAYLADITYGTNHEFGFDFLRDNLAYSLEGQVQRGHGYAIIDEVDSILIDEARTPLIIAAPDTESSEYYKTFARVSAKLEGGDDYAIDEKLKTVSISEAGIEKVEHTLGLRNLYSPENLRLVHYLEESLRAKALFKRDRDYVIKDGEVIIVDEFTGRLMHGRRYSGGLHQAIEAKEGVLVKEESRTYAKITIQNYFRLYRKIGGMTGTAQTSAEEFHKVYGLEVVSVPPNRPMVREDLSDAVYKNTAAKLAAIVADVKERRAKGQPVLIGTVSIAKNELLGAALQAANIPHEMLNAKNNEREGAIIAQAGRAGAVTVATNMAGRGVDIILGGNPPTPEAFALVREAGGLHVIGTERHEARRIDNQLRGRSGRQGDPGSTQFFLSLEDDLLRIFGGERIGRLMSNFNIPDDVPIHSKFVSRAVAQAQSKIEGMHFDARKHLLEYDDILNKQRSNIYRRRQGILEAVDKNDLRQLVKESLARQMQLLVAQVASGESVSEWQLGTVKGVLEETRLLDVPAELDELLTKIGESDPHIGRSLLDEFGAALSTRRAAQVVDDPQVPGRLLSALDFLWMSHLEDMESVQEAVRIRAYGQHDPLVEYRREARRLFQQLLENFDGWIFSNLFRLITASGVIPQNAVMGAASAPQVASIAPAGPVQGTGVPTIAPAGVKVGRNDPCPCGSGKKYKRCHGQ